ncbi:Ketosteroid isomerase-like protein [Frankia sp. AiPs1]|uniref:nuclear transport factor 2 family protein n=1 Tax=Frankia sp. AiPa1 TaxID=573492 RepID=UPI00202B9F5C|nr:nuclear transport factor 2 family protein [Frankia sp. AiPa1]MCL9759799.1 nuclear transport factor 2 family protein [Frankia sp. AiPa1]
MTLSTDDRIAIADLIHRYGHLIDAGDLAGIVDLFTADVTYDVSDFGYGTLVGVAAIRAAALAVGEANPVGHHVTNLVLDEQPGGEVHARSKGIGVHADGTTVSVTHDDVVVRDDHGWRISHRKITARQAPLGGVLSG